MKIKKTVGLCCMILLLCTMSPVSVLAASASEPGSTFAIQPYSTIQYGNFYLSGGGSYYFMNNGGNFSIRAGQTVSVTYNCSVSLNLYFHNSSTGTNTRIFGSYTPNRLVTGFFYITNPTSTRVYVTNFSLKIS